MNDEPTESHTRDHAEPDNVGETVVRRNNFTLHKPEGFGKPNIETKSYSSLATWKSLPSRNTIVNETLKEVILQNLQKSNDCTDKRNGTLTHKERLTLFRAIVPFVHVHSDARENDHQQHGTCCRPGDCQHRGKN